jgi:putative chitinase
MLVAAGLPAALADRFGAPLAAACGHFCIDTPARVAGFFGQCWVESQAFTRLEENLFYDTPERIRAVFPSAVPTLAAAAPLVHNPPGLADVVYAGKLGNGDASSGDGWRYRGRGLCGLTGRANYAAAARACEQPYEGMPDRVATPVDAAMTAAWFWSQHGCNAAADRQDWDAITRLWNGRAMLQADLRAQRSAIALKVFS